MSQYAIKGSDTEWSKALGGAAEGKVKQLISVKSGEKRPKVGEYKVTRFICKQVLNLVTESDQIYTETCPKSGHSDFFKGEKRRK